MNILTPDGSSSSPLYSLSSRLSASPCTSSTSSTFSTATTSATSAQPTAKAMPSLPTCTNPLLSMKDWFTYVYRIDNIEEIIKGHESQQSFIQSPIFQFKSHQAASKCPPSPHNSNWRLIFYPNGAGTDCKNFLSIFLKYLSDEPVKIQMMFSIVNNNNEDVYVKYTVNKFNKGNDWGFKQLIHKNAILFQQGKFLRNGALSIRVKMRLDEHKNEYIKKLNDNLHYCKILSENLSQYYDNNESGTAECPADVVGAQSDAATFEHAACLSETPQSSASGCSSCSTTTSTTTVANSLFYDCLLVVKSQPPESYLSVAAENAVCKIGGSANRRKSFENQTYPAAKRVHLTPSDENSVLKSDDLSGPCSAVAGEIHEFRAHKCILAARSPVFKAMFNYRLKENITNRVIIEDCKPEVVKAMLKYLYTAYLPDENLSAIAVDLFIAAEKYYIESLKLKVREFLVENLNGDNVMQTFVLAELYNDAMLRKQSLKFICDNIERVTQHSDWDDYLKMYPQFFTNAFVRLCKKDF